MSEIPGSTPFGRCDLCGRLARPGWNQFSFPEGHSLLSDDGLGVPPETALCHTCVSEGCDELRKNGRQAPGPFMNRRSAVVEEFREYLVGGATLE